MLFRINSLWKGCAYVRGITALVALAAIVGGALWPATARAQDEFAPFSAFAALQLNTLGSNPLDIQVTWYQSPLDQNGVPADGLFWGTLNRVPGGVPFPLGAASPYDDTACQLDTRYGYYLTGEFIYYIWAESYDEDGNLIYGWTLGHTAITSETIYVTVRKAGVAANQTVDTRMDMRYETPPLVNFPFANTLYRGGLFVGCNQDGSQVARTYLKFTGLAGPIQSGEGLWPVGGVDMYCTRLARDGAANVVCSAAASSNWDPATINWGNAPAPVGSGDGALTISWNHTNPTEQWLKVSTGGDVASAIASGSGSASGIIMAADESGSGTATTASPGWTYFARSAYQENNVGMGAYLLYAYGAPPSSSSISSLTFSNSSLSNPGDTTAGTIHLSGPAPSGGTTITLSSSDPSVTVPATVAIPAGQNTATFNATCAQSVAENLTVFIKATAGGNARVATLTVNGTDD